ncbi:hypothetical protein G7046_g6183 [Stylonectria norvegica]|nr:hypothetical protein G7046_g6183 [Stylonectria norvegica]
MSSGSPPPTPSPDVPQGAAEERFIEAGLPVEWPELYRPGGYHPVSIGDTLGEGRYRVIRKLGDGSFSTVWLAENKEVTEELPKYIALKVMMARQSSTAVKTELEIHAALAEAEGEHGSSGHNLKLLTSFGETGPNGTHTCLVFNPMGINVSSGIDKLPQYRHVAKSRAIKRRYPTWMAKRILKHTLLGLARLHRCGIVHADLQPANLLFTTRALDDLDASTLTQDIEETTEPIERLDGKVDRWAPPYLALGQPLYGFVDFSETLEIEISDLGGAFFSGNSPDEILTPTALRAPEIILKQAVDEKLDVWSFGCLVYELVTGYRLFSVRCYEDDDVDEVDDDHMLELNDILGGIPNNLMAIWPRSGSWLGPNGERLNPQPESPTDDEFAEDAVIREPLEALFQKNKPDDISSDEAKAITALIRRILTYAPSQRPTAEELLQEEWFNSS